MKKYLKFIGNTQFSLVDIALVTLTCNDMESVLITAIRVVFVQINIIIINVIRVPIS